ncbi:MAG TPA: hypothetical protein EYP17_05345 [Candidatus Latescibacteria bacterium]|nr:hypothetical protein [Candidatus Latescibacterota bacterium]
MRPRIWEVPIGLVTAKSVGASPREGYPEPIFSQCSIDSLSTAVGLSNPGYRAWIEEIKEVYPLEGKFLLVSVFGETVEEFVEVAEAIAPYADGVELNFCCPHSLRYGEALARRGDLTVEVTRSVRRIVDRPIVVKLSPNVSDIAGGGIRGAKEVLAYREAGGNIFSVGTSLAGMDTPTLRVYFEGLLRDVKDGGSRAESLALNRWLLRHEPFQVASVERYGDITVLRFDRDISAGPGQFVLVWLPGVGEKPFGIAGDRPLVLGVRPVGEVSRKLCGLRPGDRVKGAVREAHADHGASGLGGGRDRRCAFEVFGRACRGAPSYPRGQDRGGASIPGGVREAGGDDLSDRGRERRGSRDCGRCPEAGGPAAGPRRSGVLQQRS